MTCFWKYILAPYTIQACTGHRRFSYVVRKARSHSILHTEPLTLKHFKASLTTKVMPSFWQQRKQAESIKCRMSDFLDQYSVWNTLVLLQAATLTCSIAGNNVWGIKHLKDQNHVKIVPASIYCNCYYVMEGRIPGLIRRPLQHNIKCCRQSVWLSVCGSITPRFPFHYLS